MGDSVISIVKRLFLHFGLKVERASGFQIMQNSLSKHSGEFGQLYCRIASYTLVDPARCFILYQFAQYCAKLSGDIAEIGVYRGGTAKLLAQTIAHANRGVHIFDTFSGMPPTDASCDFHKKGDFSQTSFDTVKEYLSDCPNVRVYPGLFPTTVTADLLAMSYCLVHIDVDIYKSVMDCCHFFYPRMVKSGIMVFDDYGFTSCPGAKKAVDEFFEDKTEKPIYIPNCQCFVIKQ